MKHAGSYSPGTTGYNSRKKMLQSDIILPCVDDTKDLDIISKIQKLGINKMINNCNDLRKIRMGDDVMPEEPQMKLRILQM